MNHKVIIIERTRILTTQKETLTQEEEMIIENFKRIMSKKKTRLSSLRNQNWKKKKN